MRYERRTQQYDPTLHAPARYWRACNDEERAVGRLGTNPLGALTPLARLLLCTESIASSKVEELHVDARDLARGEAKPDTGGKISATTAEVLANVDAMELAIDDAAATTPFDPNQIVAIHRRLMTAAPHARIAGRVRTEQHWIGGDDHNPCGADFVPPPPELVKSLLADLCDAMADETLPPLVHAALVHAQFETIRPFSDGNGRTGRALIHVVLRRREIAGAFVPPICVIFVRDRDPYIEGLIAYRHGEVDGWVEHFAISAKQAADLAASYLAQVTELTERWRSMLAAAHNLRSDAAAWGDHRGAAGTPRHHLCGGWRRDRAGESCRAQRSRTARWRGRAHPGCRRRRNRSWEADGLIGLITQLEGGEQPETKQT